MKTFVVCRQNKINPRKMLPCCSPRLLLTILKTIRSQISSEKEFKQKKKPKPHPNQTTKNDSWGMLKNFSILTKSHNPTTKRLRFKWLKQQPLLHHERTQISFMKQMGHRETKGSEYRSEGRIYSSSIREAKGHKRQEMAKRIRVIAAFFFFKSGEPPYFPHGEKPPCRKGSSVEAMALVGVL